VDLIDVVFRLLTLLTVLVTGGWAYFRFRREGVHDPRIELDLDCVFLGPQSDAFVAAFSIYADNKGQLEHRFSEIRLRVRGVRRGEPLAEWKERKPLLLFPEEIFTKAEIVPPKYPDFFVRPGVRQRISYVTSIPAEYSFILARVTFRYEHTNDIHTAERAFKVPTVPPNRASS